MPSIVVPLLSDHKKLFVCNRLFETLFGGLRFFFGYSVPPAAYAVQILMHQIPFLIGSVFTILSENVLLSQLVAACSCGILVTFIVAAKQIITIKLHSCTSPVLLVQPQHKLPVVLEDDFVISETNFNVETARYLFPKTKFFVNYIIHSALTGILTGYAVVYLSPSQLSYLFSRSAIVYLIFTMGWMAHCTAVYSLSVRAPPETATFQLLDRWETKPLMRPFYVALFYVVDAISWYSSSQVTLNAAMHILFVFLPLLWLFNLLPPIEALFFWALEQIHIWVAGGSPAVAAYKLFCQLVLWILAVILIFFLPKYLILPLSAVLGYLLSLDIGYLLNRALLKITRNSQSSFPVNWWQCSDFIFFTVMFLAVLSLSLGLHFGISAVTARGNDIAVSCLGWILVLLYVCTWFGSCSQSVYLCGGLMRNCLYPATIRHLPEFVKALRKLETLGHTRAILTYIAAPLMLNAYITMLQTVSYFKGPCNTTIGHLGYVITTLRAFRWNWQQVESALFEVTIVHFVIECTNLPQHINDSTVILLFAALILDRLRNLMSKLHTFTVLLMASVAQEKQRRPYSCVLFGCNLIFFPLVLACLIFAAIISAPLLPLFTLPIFWIGFPRPISFWPKEDGKSGAPCQDSIYYEELIPGLVKKLSHLSANGSLGEMRPGDEFLLRFDDRLMWLSVQECGYGYCRITVKGLELQQTSCHAVEASAVDAILDGTFEVNTSRQCCHCNMTPFHIYQPITAAIIKTYVDTRNVLTGLINSPETLQMISDAFPKCLIWILLSHFAGLKDLDTKVDEKLAKNVEKPHNCEPSLKRPSTAERYAQLPKAAPIYDILADLDGDAWHDEEDLLENFSSEKIDERPKLLLEAFNAAEDADEKGIVSPIGNASLPGGFVDDFGKEEGFFRQPINKNEVVDFQLDELKYPFKPTVDKSGTDSCHNLAMDSFWSDGVITDTPSVAKSDANNLVKTNTVLRTSLMKYKTTTSASIKLDRLSAASVKSNRLSFDSDNSTAVKTNVDDSQLLFPADWLTSPISYDLLLSLTPRFPITWFKLASQKIFENSKGRSLCSDDHIIESYRKLVCTCDSVINQITAANSGKRCNLTPSLVQKMFNREMPWSPLSDWLIRNKVLYELVIKSFRYACKVGLDQSLLGDADSDSEFMDYMEEYDRTWFIGADNEPGWLEAVKCQVPNLFSLGYNPSAGTYTSHLLTRNLVPVYIGQLNKEAVRAVWSSLSLELLYLTNDDEERYSIQAHSGLLRNLTVQGADPPLGYPIYMAQNVLVKTLPTQAFL